MSNKAIRIADREISAYSPPLIIAEVSANHLGNIDRAIRQIEVAAECGADCVKFQTYTADTITLDCDDASFQITDGPWQGQTLHALYKSAYTPFEWHEQLFARARELGLIPLSTPFDQTAVDLLHSLDAPAYKIASFEIVDLPLIASVAKLGRPMIISTGMANLGEIQEAVTTARSNGCTDLILLHCTSGYPTPFADANLRTLPHLAEAFGVIGGLSDHTSGTASAVAAIALGARVIEKHFTLSRDDGGPDAAFSLEPDELKRLVEDCRSAFDALGNVNYNILGSEAGNVAFRRSLFVVRDIRAGEALTPENVRSIRPGNGLPPKALPDVLGRKASRDLKRGEPLTWGAVE